MRRRAASRRFSPEEGARVRQFVEDAVMATIDAMLESGYLLRAEGGLGKERRGPEGSVTLSLSEPERCATLELMSQVMSRL